jgi:hypothetical protein
MTMSSGYVNLRNTATVRRILRAVRRLLVDPRHSDVQGFAVGFKKVGNKTTAEVALIVLVDAKPSGKDGPNAPLVPPGSVVDAGEFLQDDAFAGQLLLLDVQPVGRLMPQGAFSASLAMAPSYNSLRALDRPAFPGSSLAHGALAGTGTLGAVLRDDGGNLYLLSNNHVLALETGVRDGVVVGGRFGIAVTGDPILQPGDEPPRKKLPGDLIASLSDFVPLYFVGASVPVETNYCDVALARVNDPATVLPSVPFLGASGRWIHVNSVADTIRIDDVVFKVGRTSGATRGTVTAVEATVRITYDAGMVLFDRQCLTTPMSAAGDSGSLIIESNGVACGILLGGSDSSSIFSPMLTILELFERRLGFSLSLA